MKQLFSFSIFLIIVSNSLVFGQRKIEKAIQAYFESHHIALGLEQHDLKNWRITDNYVSSKTKIRHVHIVQTIHGIDIQNGVANITLNGNDSIVNVASRLVGQLKSKFNGDTKPSINSKDALTNAAKYLNIIGEAGVVLKSIKRKSFTYDKGSLSNEDIQVNLKLWENGKSIRLVWVVSILEKNKNHWWQVFIDAEDGQELNRIDWATSCNLHSSESHKLNSNYCTSQLLAPAPAPPPGFDQYNVFALPVESPNHGPRSLEIGPSNAIASPFGWHDDNGVVGEEYTITQGNNVFAYEDVDNDNLPGLSADGGASLNFDFALNLNQQPVNYQNVAITNLFYTCNRIHDILYQYGFDEQSGNFQTNNYGNGGAELDNVLAEAQDGGGSNNANFMTPPDGQNPTMQMYLWAGASGGGNILTVNSPTGIAGVYFATEAGFGPGLPATPLTGNLVLVNDATTPFDDGCQTLTNAAAINGNIAVIIRGTCSFTAKVEAAQNAGAIAVIVVNNTSGTPTAMGGTSAIITIPSVMISNVDGALIMAAMSGTVNVTLNQTAFNYDIDGDFDNGVVVHEYGHGISTRLTGGPSNSDCLNNDEQMGEGWSDFFSCMLTMDLSVLNPVNRPMGTYANFELPSGNGIRNVPYDTSFLVNDYTYADVADAGNISLPHGIGFVWATMLWDLNWALIDQYGFDANIETGTGGNNIALQLVVEGLKLQPCSPGFVDGRDAILLADELLYGGANKCLIWKVFAKRGLGYSADQGSSSSRSDQVEAFNLPPICLNPIVPPIANFNANQYTTCTGEIVFEDLSTNIPQEWLWDFGDGTTDNAQNPTHVYSDPGFYTVTLTVTNTLGNDSQVMNNFIEVTSLLDPSVVNGAGCPQDSILLTASGTNSIHWSDLSGNLLAIGNTYYAPASNVSTSFYATNAIDYPTYNVGPLDWTIGTAANHNNDFIGAINFNASTEITIISAWVNSSEIGPRIIRMWDQHNSLGNVIQTITVDIPFIGPGRINLGFNVPGAGQYSIGLDSANLYRNNAGAVYPYTIPGLISIVGSPASSVDFYYYFYDVEVSKASCLSNPVMVTATVDTIDFSWNINSLTVDFTDLTPIASSWSWDFGDGTVSNLQNPTHTYSQNGIYTVTLLINGGPCYYAQDVNIGAVSIAEINKSNLTFSLFPNPTSNETKLVLNKDLTDDANVLVYSFDGKLIDQIDVPKGTNEMTIPCNSLAPQMYFIILETEEGQFREKLVVEK